MNNAILGFSSGISRTGGYSVWTRSALATGNDVHVLHTDSTTPIPGVRTFRVRPRWMPSHKSTIHHFAHIRWESIARWMATIGRRYSAVCLSDVRDSVFQRDPFPLIVPGRQRWIGGCPEPWKASEHEWCRDQMTRMKAILAEPWDDGMEFCGGCLFGDPESLLDLAKWMAAACRFVAAHGLSDQAPLNLYLRGQKSVIVAGESVYLHGEAVKTGYIDAEEGWQDVAIYHQYDRVPRHAAAIRVKWPIPTDAVRTQVIISRYEEDISALTNQVCDFSPIVYDKGNGTSGGIPRPNIGFESETWMHHFAKHYHTLPEVTLCLQGDPLAHCTEEALIAILKRDPETITFEPLGVGREQRPDGMPDHPGLAEPLGRLWRALFVGKVPPGRWYCWYGGQFAVHRDIVRRRSRKWYARAAKLIRSKADACAVERMWPLIFSP